MQIRTGWIVSVAALGLLAGGAGAAEPSPPAAGDPAPEFRLQDQDGKWWTLADYRGDWVALYFYPRDDTPGCTTEACSFRDNIFAFRKAGARIVGISVDDTDSHKAFAEKHGLPFPLLADADKDTALRYGVLSERGFASRQTFLIDPAGLVAKHYATVDPESHAQQILDDLSALNEPAP